MEGKKSIWDPITEEQKNQLTKQQSINAFKLVKRKAERDKDVEANKILNKIITTKNLKEKAEIIDEATTSIGKKYGQIDEEGNERIILKKVMEDFSMALEPLEKLAMTTNLNPMICRDPDAKFEAFQKFKQISLISYLGFLKGQGIFKGQIEQMTEFNPPLINKVCWILEDAKIFNIPDEINELIIETDNEIKFRKPPFHSIYINREITLGTLRIFGICVIEIGGVRMKDGHIEKGIEIVAMGVDDKDKAEFWNYFQISDSGINKDVEKDSLKEISEKTSIIAKYVCNFLDLLNHPNITYEVVKHGLNETREKKGKLRINDRVNITVSGRLYRYIYEEIPKQKREFTHRFWVRGHFKHFKNKARFVQIYKLSNEAIKEHGYQMNDGIICKWVFPFIRGKGELINKRYTLKKNEQEESQGEN
jgi:hypothetical protein